MILIHNSIPFQLKNKYIDPSGRYLILNGSMLSTEINIIKIYAPNGNNTAFYQNIFLSLSSYSGQYINNGGFNCVLDPELDCCTTIDTSNQQTRKTIKKFMVDLKMIFGDILTLGKKIIRASQVHLTYSGIDYFLISNGLLSKRCWYDSIFSYNHVPFSLIMQVTIIFPPSRF